jgi:hypothetical protein
MKDKPLYIIWVCFAVIFLVHLTGSKGWAQGETDNYPQVRDSVPYPGQRNVPPELTNITINFLTSSTAQMDRETTLAAFHFYVKGTYEDIDNLKDQGTLTLDVDDATLTFTPPLLQPGKTYCIKIKSTATDTYGNPLDGNNDSVGGGKNDDWVMEFTTTSQNPQVQSSDPALNQTDVPLSQDITITFTSPMDLNTTTNAFHFYAEGTDEDMDNLRDYGTLNIDGDTLTFIPPVLQYGTSYWVKIKSTARDQAGNLLDSKDGDGTGGEADEDDWKITFTTSTNIFTPVGHWSQIYNQIGQVSSLAADSQNRLWAVTSLEGESHIYRFDGHTWEDETPSSTNFQISSFPCMTIDKLDRVWVGIDTDPMSNLDAPRLAKLEKNTNTWQTISAKTLGLVANEGITKIATDSTGNVWIVALGGKIIKYHNGQIDLCPTNGLPEDGDITSLAIDQENNVWVGTLASGAYQLPSGASKWESYQYQISRPIIGSANYSITDIAVGPAGYIWVGTTCGLLRLNPSDGASGGWAFYTQATSQLPGDLVTSLAVDPNTGDVWIGTTSGLGRFDGNNTWINYAGENDNALSGQSINALALNSRGEAWIGTDEGVVMRDEISPFVVRGEIVSADTAHTSTGAIVRITFSEPMKHGEYGERSVTENAFTLRGADQEAIEGDFSWSDDGTTMEFTPRDVVLQTDQSYKVSINTSATDLAGNSLALKYNVSLSTNGGQTPGRSLLGGNVNLAGSGCFIKSLGTQTGSWLSRLLKFAF